MALYYGDDPIFFIDGNDQIWRYEDTYMDDEAASITTCCGNYMDSDEQGNLICRSCKQVVCKPDLVLKAFPNE
jgi:hypothetical protein